MTTLVIGAVMHYDYTKIEPWLVSLKRTGYEGKIALIAYAMDKPTIDKLTEKGVSIVVLATNPDGSATYPGLNSPNFNIMVERFAHAWFLLQNIDPNEVPDSVLITDVGDVIFQENPEYFLADKLLSVSGENFKYRDEPWSSRNMQKAFGDILLQHMQDKEIYCAGVIGGSYDIVRDLCLQIWLVCRGSAPHTFGGGGPDQAALNILLNSAMFMDYLGWNKERKIASHLGTHPIAIQSGSGDIGLNYVRNGVDPTSKFLQEPDHIIAKDGKHRIYQNDGETLIPIVHQYNRIPLLKEEFEKEFRE